MKETIVRTIKNDLLLSGQGKKDKISFFLPIIASIVVLIISVSTIAKATSSKYVPFKDLFPGIFESLTDTRSYYSVYYTSRTFPQQEDIYINENQRKLIREFDKVLGFSNIPTAEADLEKEGTQYYWSDDGKYVTHWKRIHCDTILGYKIYVNVRDYAAVQENWSPWQLDFKCKDFEYKH